MLWGLAVVLGGHGSLQILSLLQPLPLHLVWLQSLALSLQLLRLRLQALPFLQPLPLALPPWAAWIFGQTQQTQTWRQCHQFPMLPKLFPCLSLALLRHW